jgi:hypothetical protein
VKYPQAADNYRRAHGIAQAQESGDASTEDQRDAMLRYRTLFEQIVGMPQGGDTATTQSAGTSSTTTDTASAPVNDTATTDRSE